MNIIQAKVDALRSRARRLRWLFGLSYLLAVVLATVLALATLDYLFKFSDLGVRLIFSLVVLGAALWAAYRFVWQIVRQPLTDVAISKRVEKQFPQLGDRLSSSIEFLKQQEDDALAGSAALRRAVIAGTTAEIEPLDFSQAIERQPTRKAMRIAALVSLSALLLAAANPTVARVALARLANPFGNVTFPRRTNLQIVGDAPSRLPVGQAFELHVTDRDGKLPDEAILHIRYDSLDGETAGESRTEPMQHLNDVLVARKDNVTRPFFYRVTGGDDYSMPWMYLEVVEPPRVQSLRVRLQPPAYTGWNSVPSDRQIQAIRGTRVELTATITRPLKTAVLRQEHGPAVAASVGKDGLTVNVPADPARPFVIDKSGAYWLEMTDLEGIRGGTLDRWEVRAVPDAAPTVTIERPTANQFVTTEAEIPLTILAKDDLAIRDVQLHFTRSENADVEDQQLELFQGPASPPTPTRQSTVVPMRGESRSIDFRWRLSPLKLKPGAHLAFHAVASDYLPQTGQSPERRITIITRQELDERLAQRQATILNELTRVLKLQQEARVQVSDLQIQLDKVGRLEKPDIDHAQSAELNQRVVKDALTGEDRGLPAQIDDLLEQLDTNRVDSPDIERLMTTTLGELKRLDREHLMPLAHDLTVAIKNARSELGAEKPAESSPPAARQAIAKVGGHQDAVVRSLEQLAAQMAQWGSYRRFGRDVAELQRDQQELEAQTAEIAAKTLGQDRDALRPQQQAAVSKLAERQRELGRRLDKARQQMAEMGGSLLESDPLAAATLEDAARQAAERGISGQMREASRQLDGNRVGQAREAQQQISRELSELLDILAGRREQELSRLVKRLREAEHDLQTLRKRQAALRKQMESANQLEDQAERKRQLERLSREQRQLEQEAARFARKLERLQAEKAGRSTQSAAARMDRASQSGSQGNGEEASEQADRAQNDLDEAQQQLAQRRQQAELDLAREQIVRMQDGLKSLADAQQGLLSEAQRLESLRQAEGRFTRPQIISVRDLGRAQRGLESEARSMAEKVTSAEVFHLALETIGSDMKGAAELLETQNTGEPTQSRQQHALRRIGLLLEALKASSQRGDGSSGGQGGSQQQNAGAQDTLRALAEVKLLKLMQEDLNARFQELVTRKDTGDELARLSQEQGKLAEMMQNFSTPAEEPEALPDLLQEEPSP